MKRGAHMLSLCFCARVVPVSVFVLCFLASQMLCSDCFGFPGVGAPDHRHFAHKYAHVKGHLLGEDYCVLASFVPNACCAVHWCFRQKKKALFFFLSYFTTFNTIDRSRAKGLEYV